MAEVWKYFDVAITEPKSKTFMAIYATAYRQCVGTIGG